MYGIHRGVGCISDEDNKLGILIEERKVIEMINPDDMEFSSRWHLRR
jgi:hypothetical protein